MGEPEDTSTDKGTQSAAAFDLARIDAEYEPIDTAEAWGGLVVDQAAWDRVLERLTLARNGASSEVLRHAVEIAMRAAAVDTGAIEGLYEVDRGFTFTVAFQSTAWQVSMAEKGENVRELFDAQLLAYEIALDVATRSMPITEAWLRRLHEELCRPQDTVEVHTPQGVQRQALLKGAYKRLPNHVMQLDGAVVIAFAPVSDTPGEMQKLVAELNSAQFAELHPVLQAAYAHYSLVRIHPFQDGNGRVARALASVFLYRAASVPLVLFADEKKEYLEALRTADQGDRQPVADFIFDRATAAMELVGEQVTASPEDRVADLRTLLLVGDGMTHNAVDEVGYRVLEMLQAELDKQANDLHLPAGIGLSASAPQIDNRVVPDGYRQLLSRGPKVVYLVAQSQPPAQANVTNLIRVLVPKDLAPSLTFRIASSIGPSMDVRLRDLFPEPRTYATMRIASWVKSVLDATLKQLRDGAANSLRSNGYV